MQVHNEHECSMAANTPPRYRCRMIWKVGIDGGGVGVVLHAPESGDRLRARCIRQTVSDRVTHQVGYREHAHFLQNACFVCTYRLDG
jgi:hypothetical protein